MLDDTSHRFNTDIHNPIMVSFIAKGLLPYHGLGSGIQRALKNWPKIDFTDDHDRCLFIATVHRKPVGELILAGDSAEGPMKGSEKSSEKILGLIKAKPTISAAEIAQEIGITSRAVEKQIDTLKKAGMIRRIGPAKGGLWEVIK